MRQTFLSRIGLKIAVIGIAVLLVAAPSFSKEAMKVAVCPFEMNAAQDLGFLQNGLFDMLYTRFSDPGKVVVIDRETIDDAIEQAKTAGKIKGKLNEQKARIVGQELGVDYIMFGSLNLFGQSVSLDGGMVDVSGKKPTLTFFEQSDKMGDVIPMVNSFAGDVNEKIFNRSINNEMYTPEARKYMASSGIRPGYQGNDIRYDKGFVRLDQGSVLGFETHLKFKGQINAMAAGDVKKDGDIRIVTATNYTVYIHKLNGKMLEVDEKIDVPTTNRIISLDVADINNNGYPEIFVTSLNLHREGLQSFVLEYDGQKFVTLTDDEPYFFRVITGVDKASKVLVAQKSDKSPYHGDFYEMTPSGNEYTRGRRIKLPREVSVLSFAAGPVTSEDVSEFVLINKHERLLVVSDGGSVEWKGNSKMGGLKHFWDKSRGAAGAIDEPIYLNPRIQFYRPGDEGKSNVITIRNEDSTGGLGRYKRFKKGNIEIMNWDGIALSPVFRTKSVQGWISDFAIFDIDDDGGNELVVSVCAPSGILGGALGSGESQTSNIISYDLEKVFQE